MDITLAAAQTTFVDAEIRSGRYVDAGEVVRQALRLLEARRNYAVLGSLADGDIEALAFITLMEAAKSAQEDLKSIMAGVKAINAAKALVRERLIDVQRDC